MENRGRNRGNQGQGERNVTGKASNPLKGIKPIRDRDGKVTGYEVKVPGQMPVPKTFEWGRQQGISPTDFEPKVRPQVPSPTGGSSDGTKMVIGTIILGGAAIGCVVAEPCGAMIAVDGGAALATQ